MKNYIDSLNWRYAVKKYDNTKKVSAEDLATLKEAIRLSASSYGLQPYKIIIVENPELRVYWVDPGDMQTQMHQEAFPGEDITDRPLPETSVAGILKIIEKEQPSGRYKARE